MRFAPIQLLVNIHAIWYRIVFVLYAVLLFYLTHKPTLTVSTEGVIPLDKQMHIGAFGGWVGLLILARFYRGGSNRKIGENFSISMVYIIFCVVIGILWAGIDEYTQGFEIVGRHRQWGDWFADVIGMVLAGVIMAVWVWYKSTRLMNEQQI